jgi:hypothetical protein
MAVRRCHAELQEASASKVGFEPFDVETTSGWRMDVESSKRIAESIHASEEVQHQGVDVLRGDAGRKGRSGARLRTRM